MALQSKKKKNKLWGILVKGVNQSLKRIVDFQFGWYVFFLCIYSGELLYLIKDLFSFFFFFLQ